MKPDPRGQSVQIGETLLEQSDIVRALHDRVLELSHSLPFGERDARRTMLNSAAAAISGEVAILNVLHHVGSVTPESACVILRVTAPDYLRYPQEDLMRTGRLHMLVEYQFQIENGLRNLLRVATGSAPSKFYQVAADATRLAGLKKDITVPTLMIPAHLRNSMHNNGIHTGYKGADTVAVVEGVRFEFRHGQRVQCGKLEYIVHALQASVGVVEQIVCSPQSRSIAEVTDAYVEQFDEPD